LPDYSNRVKTFSEIFAPIANYTVAAGDDALMTRTVPSFSRRDDDEILL
jgi:hypothetical protein